MTTQRLTPAGEVDTFTGLPCPQCDGPWWPFDIRGILTFQHRIHCRYDTAERQTIDADSQRGQSFTRRATDTEIELLTDLGYAPDRGSPLATHDPGTLTRVHWIGPVRRRTFPTLAPTEDGPALPHPDAPWPTPNPPPATPAPPTRHPETWHTTPHRRGRNPWATRFG